MKNTSNLIVHDPTKTQPVQSRRPSQPDSRMRSWCAHLLSALLLLLLCGSASAQPVNVLAWTNGVMTPAANVATVAGWDLDDRATVFVVGVYSDNSSTYTGITFGGVAPDGFMNNSGNSRMAVAYWINPNTATNQSLVVNYVSPNQGYYWAYQLSGVNTNVPVLQSDATTLFATSTSLTTTNYNTLIISFFSVNNAANPNTVNSLTPNSPLIQCGTTMGNASAGASMASATNNIFAPGLQTISWNALNPPGTANAGLAALGFVAGQPGAPGVLASANPPAAAPGYSFTVTATTYPGIGNVTNVSLDLSPLGGSSVNNLVQSSTPNVWTNTVTVPSGFSVPSGFAFTTNLPVTATEDTAPTNGFGYLNFTVYAPVAPLVSQDINPSGVVNVYAGQGILFSASFTGPPPITYQWQKSPDEATWSDIPNETNRTYTLGSYAGDGSDDGFWRLKAHNPFGDSYSSDVYTFAYPGVPQYLWSSPISFAGLNYDQMLTNFPGTYVAGALVAKPDGNPIVVSNSNGSVITFAGSGAWATLSGGAGYSSGAYTNNSGNANFNSCLNATYYDNATHTITMNGLKVGQQYQMQLFALDNRNTLTPPNSSRRVAWQDPSNVDDTSQSYTMADNVYMLGTFIASNTVMTVNQQILATNGNFNCMVLRAVGWEPPPYFVQQPVNKNGFAGTNLSLSASAAGDTKITSPTINYQWESGPTNGPYAPLTDVTKYAGMTTATLTISNLVNSDGDVVYVLKATDSGGTTLSHEARVYVQSPLMLPAPNSFGAAVLALTNNKPVGFWQLNETNDPSSGLLVAIDASGKGHSGIYGNTAHNGFNGVLSPQPPLYAGFATNQGALQTTSGDANSVVNLPALNTTSGVDTTICMWINPSAVAAVNTGLLYNRSSVDQCGMNLGGTAGGPSGQYNLAVFWANANGEATYNWNSGLYPVNNTWNFVVLVVTTNALTYYLDYVDANGVAHLGKSADTASRYTQQVWGGTPIWLGGDPNGTEFPGSIANVAMFNSALTDDQISALFAAGFQTAGFPAGIAQQPPASQTNYLDYTAQISAQPGGSSPITNQWTFDGTNLVDGWYNGTIVNGSTSNVLTLINVSSNWNGVYNLAVTNAISGTVSSNSMLTIATPSAPPAGNLVGEWFDGTDSLADHSGYSPAGTHDAYGVGANGTNYRFTNSVPPGKSGDSLNLFGGTSMGISNSSTNDAGYVNTFDEGISNSFTVAVWARGQPAAWNPFVSKYGETTPSPQAGWQLRRSAGANAVFTMRGTGATDDPAGAAGGSGADGAWHLYVGTYDLASGIRALYVDGIVENVTTGAGPYILASGERLVLGGKSTNEVAAIDGTANFTGGMLYDVRIYNVALTASQVAYLAPPPPLPPLPLTAKVTAPSGGNPGQMTLTWLNGGLLLESTNLDSPWTTNTAATPPYVIQATNSPSEFYKVLFPEQ